MEDLLAFLSMPLSDGTAVLEQFATLPGAVFHRGTEKLQRFVYVPGTRKDRVVLLAHTDTIWDDAYLRSEIAACLCVDETQGIIHSAKEEVGIGADDRAGCAMLWKLRNSGHSLLLLDGEECGHHGAVFLRKKYPALFRELNRHRYLLQLDLWGASYCMYHKIPNSKKFCRYIESSLSLEALDRNCGTDVSYISRQACGVNLSVGYHKQHRAQEFLDVKEWEEMYVKLSEFLAKPQPAFRTLLFVRIKRRIRALGGKILRKCRGGTA